MRALVIGSGGYIGIPLCHDLSQHGHDVIGLDRLYFGKFPNVPTLKCDIRSVGVDTFLYNSVPFDAVIDLAGLSNDASAEIDSELTKSINLEGAKCISSLAKEAGVKRYVYSSSASVYGHGGPDLIETAKLKPLTLYAECKAKVEDHIRSLEDENFKVSILRNATVFGLSPRMRFDLVVNIMALTAWRDHQIVVRGGQQWRPLAHISDVVDALRTAAQGSLPNGTYNIGRCNMQIDDVARHAGTAAPWAKIMRVTEAVDHRDYHVSFAKFFAETGLSESVYIEPAVSDIITALRNETVSGDDPTTKTVGWYRQIIDWEKRLDALRLDGKIL